MPFIKQLSVQGLLSFSPEMEPLELKPLNILIGPNGSGKSNLIEVFELLRSTPTDLAATFRKGGGINEWLWKGSKFSRYAKLKLITDIVIHHPFLRKENPLVYCLDFDSIINRVEILRETIEFEGINSPHSILYNNVEGASKIRTDPDSPFSINLKDSPDFKVLNDIESNKSILSQIKDPFNYPEVFDLGNSFDKIVIFRDWSFGRYSPVRIAQPADLATDRLLPGSENLAHILDQLILDNSTYKRLNSILKRFLPNFERITTSVVGGGVQFFLHETDLDAPIPSTRISDGTLRFLAIISILLNPNPPPLVCIEEPELGLHPDAVSLIGELLIEASERMQIIVTTHSDALVTAMDLYPENIVTCERLGTGTVFQRLDANSLKKWLEDYTLGDLWRIGYLGANP